MRVLPTSRLLPLLALSALLAACGGGQSTPPDKTSYAELSFYTPPVEGAPSALAVAVGVLNASNMDKVRAGESLSPAALVDAGELLLGPMAVVGDGGAVKVPLPEADADLEAVLVPAAELLYHAGDQCVPEVSDETVMVTPALVPDGIAVPGFFVLTAWGLGYGLLTPEKLTSFEESEFFSQEFHGLVYADAPVDVVALSDECVLGEVVADVSLEAGWNWVVWTVVLNEFDEPSHFMLQNAGDVTGLELTYFPF